MVSKQMFTLAEVSRFLGKTVPSLRTMIARNLLKYAGERPLAGDPRQFSRVGLYEVALISALEDAGLLQSAAALVVHDLFDRHIRVSIEVRSAELRRSGATAEELALVPSAMLEEIKTDPAEHLLWGVLGGDGTPEIPNLLIFSFLSDGSVATAHAHGWLEVPQKITAMQRDHYLFNPDTFTPERARRLQEIGPPYVSDEEVQSFLKYIHILNVTAVFSDLAQAIHRHEVTEARRNLKG